MAARQTKVQGFWRYAIQEDGCWRWAGRLNGGGYAIFGAERKYWIAHRISYEIHRGPIPDGLLVCHTCDNRVCTNPDHLFLGTHQDNCDDKMRKGRHKCGHGKCVYGRRKLTDEQILEIKARIALGQRNRDIAPQYKVHASAISRIRHGLRWHRAIQEWPF